MMDATEFDPLLPSGEGAGMRGGIADMEDRSLSRDETRFLLPLSEVGTSITEFKKIPQQM